MTYKQNLQDFLVKPKEYYIQYRPEMMDFIPDGAKTILDIGCGEGFFGEQIKLKLKAEVWGIEINPPVAEAAKQRMDKIFIGDIANTIHQMPDNYFDCIICNDILEHMVDPFNLLLDIKKKLGDDGTLVCSIPNIRYFTVLRDLLIYKQWKYEDAGILDKTHLRFFTRRSIIETFANLGYKINTIKGIDPINSWKFNLINILSFGYLSDTRYMQFSCVAKVKKINNNI